METLFFKISELTAERRKDLVKMISETSEKFKVSIRNIRRKFIDLVKDSEKDKTISIDESKKIKKMSKDKQIIQF